MTSSDIAIDTIALPLPEATRVDQPRQLGCPLLVPGTSGHLHRTQLLISTYVNVLALTPLQIGIGLSIAGLTSLAGSLPLGGLADRIGGHRSWILGAVVEGLAFLAYPIAHTFAGFVVIVMVTAAADTFAHVGRTIYTADAIPTEIRVRTMAFARSYLNIGFTVGAGVGAAALAINSTSALVLQ